MNTGTSEENSAAFTLAAVEDEYAVVCVDGEPVGHVEFLPSMALYQWVGFDADANRVGPACTRRADAAAYVAKAVSP